MGLFDFLKGKGKNVGLEKYENQTPPPEAERQALNNLIKMIRELNLEIEDLGLTLRDGVATIFGKTKTQAEREKVILLVGNTNGISKVEDFIEVAKPEPEAKYYTVQPGDTLSKIAAQHYGDGSKYPIIFEANKPMLKNPNEIYPGQVLRIPPLK